MILFTNRVDYLMAAKKKPKKRQQYSKNELEQAIEKVSEGEMSLRQAERAFGVPKSTLSDYVSGKVKIGQTQRPILPIVHVQSGAQGLNNEHEDMRRTENKENEDTSERPLSATSFTIEVTPLKEKHPILITVSSVLGDILVYPKLPHKEKPRMKKSAVPDYRHLTGEQMMKYSETKEGEKMIEAERKARVQAEQEAKHKARVLEPERKAKAKTERGLKKAEKKQNRKVSSKMIQLPASENDFEVSDDGTCELCGTDNPGKWISCDICELWYHTSCVGLLDYVDSVEWKCPTCNH